MARNTEKMIRSSLQCVGPAWGNWQPCGKKIIDAIVRRGGDKRILLEGQRTNWGLHLSPLVTCLIQYNSSL